MRHYILITIKAKNESAGFSALAQAYKWIKTQDVTPFEVVEAKWWPQKQRELNRLTRIGAIEYTNMTEQEYVDWKVNHKLVYEELTEQTVEEDTQENKEVQGELNHYMYPKIKKVIKSKVNLMLIGAAGSGKTTVANKAAQELGLDFYSISVGLQTSKVEFMGYMDATGKYVSTLFRQAYENGGIFLIDEMDAGNPGILTVINSALANSVCPFPDKMVSKHSDFICVAAANTFGKGADRMYVGRNQLDAATLDRFAKMNFDYDEKLEYSLAVNKDWCKLVQRIRKCVEDKKLRIVVSPRATFHGSAMIANGLTQRDALEMTIFNGLSADEITILKTTCSL